MMGKEADAKKEPFEINRKANGRQSKMTSRKSGSMLEHQENIQREGKVRKGPLRAPA